ncbi:MAG: hypothetical protein OEZ08_17740, partial [Betaproteobacteria bacterium]|nr:hypothetical protein [Betaproteobacteria bacterium]
HELDASRMWGRGGFGLAHGGGGSVWVGAASRFGRACRAQYDPMREYTCNSATSLFCYRVATRSLT